MEIVTDMGEHALYIWPSYAAFIVTFGGLWLWVRITGARAKAELERRERESGRRR